MSNKLIILQGIPGSGKTTWARNFIKENSNEWVIVNRDSIRDMLGVYWIPKRENLVSKIEKNTIIEALNSNFNVIIDATNLNHSTINKFTNLSKELKCDIEFKFFNINLNVAIWRDWKRGLFGGRKVGKKVVKSFYSRYVKV